MIVLNFLAMVMSSTLTAFFFGNNPQASLAWALITALNALQLTRNILEA
jgi:hypothetical protein